MKYVPHLRRWILHNDHVRLVGDKYSWRVSAFFDETDDLLRVEKKDKGGNVDSKVIHLEDVTRVI